jgi:hypothetical protein
MEGKKKTKSKLAGEEERNTSDPSGSQMKLCMW